MKNWWMSLEDIWTVFTDRSSRSLVLSSLSADDDGTA